MSQSDLEKKLKVIKIALALATVGPAIGYGAARPAIEMRERERRGEWGWRKPFAANKQYVDMC